MLFSCKLNLVNRTLEFAEIRTMSSDNGEWDKGGEDSLNLQRCQLSAQNSDQVTQNSI
jgi:hypothetical protein